MDTAEAIAREMVEEVGRLRSLGYLAGQIVGAGSWREARNGWALVMAVARA